MVERLLMELKPETKSLLSEWVRQDREKGILDVQSSDSECKLGGIFTESDVELLNDTIRLYTLASQDFERAARLSKLDGMDMYEPERLCGHYKNSAETILMYSKSLQRRRDNGIK